MNRPKVLIISENKCLASRLVHRLEVKGCECHFACSFAGARKAVGEHRFDLVLGPVRLRDGTIYGLLDHFTGTRTSVFFSYAVDGGCWWLPAVRHGEQCLGDLAMRASEFVPVLDEALAQIAATPSLNSLPGGMELEQRHSNPEATPGAGQHHAHIRNEAHRGGGLPGEAGPERPGS